MTRQHSSRHLSSYARMYAESRIANRKVTVAQRMELQYVYGAHVSDARYGLAALCTVLPKAATKLAPVRQNPRNTARRCSSKSVVVSSAGGIGEVRQGQSRYSRHQLASRRGPESDPRYVSANSDECAMEP